MNDISKDKMSKIATTWRDRAYRILGYSKDRPTKQATGRGRS
jgi:hypothetical protein